MAHRFAFVSFLSSKYVSIRCITVLLLSVALIFSYQAFSQDLIPQGITQWSTQVQAGPVSVDMSSGNMVIGVPGRTKNGGPLPFSFGLYDDIGSEGIINGFNNFEARVSAGQGGGIRHPNPINCGPNPGPKSIQYGDNIHNNMWWVQDATGSPHYFNFVDAIMIGPVLMGCGGDWGPDTSVAVDGSGFTAIIAGSSSTSGQLTWSVYDKNGVLVSSSLNGWTDPDGNTVTAAGTSPVVYTDALGVTPLSFSGGSGGTSAQYWYTDANGTNQYFTVAYTSQHVKTVFGCPSGDRDAPGTFLPSSVTAPTGGQYLITYESTAGFPGDVTGRLQKVTLPSGGYISFAYSGGSNGVNCTSKVIPQIQITSNDNNGHNFTTTYQNNLTVSTPGATFVVTETDALGDVTTHNMSGEYETERVVADVHLGNLSTTIFCYNGNFTSCGTASIGVGGRISQKDIYTQLGSSGWALDETTYDIYGNLTAESKWDYGATFPPSGTPASKTTYTYDTSTGPCGALSNPYIRNRPCSITSYDSSAAMASQTNFTYNSTGHATQTSQWVTGSTYLTSNTSYNANGALHTKTDPKGNITTYNYDGSCNSQLSTSTTPPTVNSVTLTTSQIWNCNGGVMTSSTDANGQTTSYSYVDPATGLADPLWRRTLISYPDGGSVTTSYSTGSTTPWSLSTSSTISSGHNRTGSSIYDGLARVTQTQVTSDSEGTDLVDTTYDALGRVATVTNPHRSTSSPTDGTTTYSYDALNRVLSIGRSDGSTASTQYTNNCSTVTDEANKARKFCTDGLGRMKTVWEDPARLNYETDYQYDGLNNLNSVNQKGDNTAPRSRTFHYDGLSRLSSASNPESGSFSYGYDGNSNLITRTDARSITATYQYDALNRMIQKSYSDSTPTVKYGYDGVALTGCTIAQPVLTDSHPLGFRTDMCDGSGSTAWSHDVMGRILIKKQKIGTTFFQATDYTYNLDGSVSTETYPTSHVYSFGYTDAQRPITVTDTTSSINYVSACSTAPCYAPTGALTQIRYGVVSGGFSGMTVQNSYNSRLQPSSLSATYSSGTIFSLSYDFHSGTGNNGSIFKITNGKDANRTQNFAYDSLNRVQQAYTAGTNWGESFSLDPWGNLTNRNDVAGKTNYEPLSVTPLSTNRLSGFGYDSAGNMTSNGSSSYSYDGESRLLTTAGYTYTYDGDGNRVMKSNGSNGTIYWRDASGNVIDEGNLSDVMQEEYVFFGGKRIVRWDVPTGHKHYYFSDQLGSANIVTSDLGVIQDESDYYPYGGEIQITNTYTNTYKFAGKERDTESVLDDLDARHFGSALGRFMTIDPANIAGDLDEKDNPQSWNEYSYVLNNPTNGIDPDGLDCIYTNNQSFSSVTVTIERGKCTQTGGTYVDGTVDVDSFTYNGRTGDLGFAFSTAAEGGAGSQVISLGGMRDNPGQLNPYAQAVFSQPALQVAAATMTDPRTYALWFAASATLGYGLYTTGAVEGGLTELGFDTEAAEGVTNPTPGQEAQVSRQLAEQGRKSLEKSLRTLERRLAEHQAKLQQIKDAGGYSSSVEREIENFKGLIQAIKNILGK